MHKRNVYLLVVTQSVIIAILLVYLVLSVGSQDKIHLLESKMAGMKEFNSLLKHRNDSLSLLIREISISNAFPPFLDRKQEEELVKKGLQNPVEDLRDDLVADPGLIITSAVLGGQMGFYLREGIHILNKRWVFAYFEDGHIAGAMLLRYIIDQQGNIEWEVFDEIIY